MSQLVDLTLVELLGEFSSPSPTPGGGSASALAATVGAALLAMVAGMSKTRTGAPAEREALDRTKEELLNGRDHLTRLIDADTAAYNAVLAAYRRPKRTEDEQSARSVAVQSALRGATEVPLDVMRASRAAAHEALVVAQHGNRAARSDVSVALELLQAARRSAASNVAVNLEGIHDVGIVEGVRDEVRHLESAMEDVVSRVRAALA
jgi:formiminotetrahydrofolate cyclodeaminase